MNQPQLQHQNMMRSGVLILESLAGMMIISLVMLLILELARRVVRWRLRFICNYTRYRIFTFLWVTRHFLCRIFTSSSLAEMLNAHLVYIHTYVDNRRGGGALSILYHFCLCSERENSSSSSTSQAEMNCEPSTTCRLLKYLQQLSKRPSEWNWNDIVIRSPGFLRFCCFSLKKHLFTPALQREITFFLPIR